MLPYFSKLKAHSVPSLLEVYQQRIDQGSIHQDDDQLSALAALQTLMDKVVRNDSWFSRKYRSTGESLGVYLYGEVGRGKSMLMDLFWECCPVKEKRRVHFHAFMLEIHEFMHRNRKSKLKDPIAHFAQQLNFEVKVLCFDEFHVIDITNAMILKRLFTRLLDLGTVIVSTSNRHPDNLYQGGFHPELFQPFIKFLKNHLNVIELAGGHDYRLKSNSRNFWLCPDTPSHQARLLDCYRSLTTRLEAKSMSKPHIYGRNLPLAAHHGGVALADFNALCNQPLGPADFKALASTYQVLVLSHVPQFGPETHNAGKRFSNLIDALYFNRRLLIASASADIDHLCLPGERAFYLKRTLSRLREMQTESYVRQTGLILDNQGFTVSV